MKQQIAFLLTEKQYAKVIELKLEHEDFGHVWVMWKELNTLIPELDRNSNHHVFIDATEEELYRLLETANFWCLGTGSMMMQNFEIVYYDMKRRKLTDVFYHPIVWDYTDDRYNDDRNALTREVFDLGMDMGTKPSLKALYKWVEENHPEEIELKSKLWVMRFRKSASRKHATKRN